jgi:hypothetical protein
MKVVIIVEDSLPNRYVGKQHTPALWELITRYGGWSEQGGCHICDRRRCAGAPDFYQPKLER